jgi:hypothetical protein
MPCDGCNLLRVAARLRKPGDCRPAKIMEMKPLDACVIALG